MGFLDEAKKSNEEAKQSYEGMKEAYEALRQDVNRLTAVVDKVAAPSFKRTIESRDRQLLEDVTRQMQDFIKESRRTVVGLNNVDKSQKTIFYSVLIVTVSLVAFCFYNMYGMREQVNSTNEKYERITAILSGDAHYWFDGENFNVAKESPTGEHLKKVNEEFREKQQQQKQQKQN